ncbi:unnamed protein product [Didymodactylos carnosus]|uniref:Uncharacterized protein n=1 Tax=Didymodactylos carnosus TaxID=1234261 RepID=A0A814W921_9BILA|nr:unnamed protein product [Didymodactylos carnosus]CAF3966374.1 unnamed protein product [Didymodactylos carnosus]
MNLKKTEDDLSATGYTKSIEKIKHHHHSVKQSCTSCKDIVNTPYAIDRDNDKQDTLTDYGEPANEATMPTTNDGSLTREVSVTSTSDGTPPSSKSTFKRENGDGGWGV